MDGELPGENCMRGPVIESRFLGLAVGKIFRLLVILACHYANKNTLLDFDENTNSDLSPAPQSDIIRSDAFRSIKKRSSFWKLAIAHYPPLISCGTVRFRELAWDGDDLYWVEGRPSESGRQVIVKQTRENLPLMSSKPPGMRGLECTSMGADLRRSSGRCLFFSLP